MMRLRKAAERAKQFLPLLAQRRELLAARGSEAIVAARASGRGFAPRGAEPAARFHAIEQRVERGERESQRSASARFDAAGQFVSMQRSLGQNREDGQFGAAAFGVWANHSFPSMLPVYRNSI